ncbi:MAG: four helix bundle protein [Acidobacteria bacterium]|nr:four helix bundle protein [Acidobacteriota bacterium]MBV9145740.1 four helix bundle protein [Acidobacteriota bacterium]MBV9434495.1 four helix bundle protein [Acidobacteriota bacterium]
MKDFRDLQVWHKAHQVVLDIYRDTNLFPPDERFGLIAQLRRSAASIPANIAEGCGRQGDGDFNRFLQIAMGSACEAEYHLLLARDLHYLTAERYEHLVDGISEVKKMLAGLIVRVGGDRFRAKAAAP